MKLIFLSLLTLLFLQVKGQYLKGSCPPPEDIPNCSCKGISIEINCRNFINPRDVKYITEILSEYRVTVFEISDSIMLFLPDEMFSHFPIEEFNIYESEILGFENNDGSSMFGESAKSLMRIFFQKLTGISAWRWNAYNVLVNLTHLTITSSDLDKIEDDFPILVSLKVLDLSFNNIEYLHKNAFTNLTNLEYLRIDNNKIDNVHRDLLPNPATELEILSFKNNEIIVIPNNFFSNMPKLKKVYIEGNKIKFLSSEIFQPLILGQRFNINLKDNDLYCCLELRFLIKADYRFHIDGFCKYPQALKGKPLSELKSSDLYKAKC